MGAAWIEQAIMIGGSRHMEKCSVDGRQKVIITKIETEFAVWAERYERRFLDTGGYVYLFTQKKKLRA